MAFARVENCNGWVMGFVEFRGDVPREKRIIVLLYGECSIVFVGTILLIIILDVPVNT